MDLDALRKAWEMLDKIKIQNVAFFDRQDIGVGWRSNLEAEWHRVVDILQRVVDILQWVVDILQ